MTRTIYLAISSNAAKPAHFSVFIPTNDSGEEGKVIHVTGSPAIGFFLEFKRNYSIADTLREYQIVPLAQVNGRYVADTVGDRQLSLDTTARDRIESIATMVPPPARSPNPFDPSAPNCQNWMHDYVQTLVEHGIVGSSALSVVQNARRIL
ncbi:hypothetical protein ANOM_002281 [Aspergillus nomiae NRRL 13137]|uniref:Uncharacterized protein n=1 Tax=Aspergillus nomiae NRRL (strain ATCC 15546 / NRRL 13137 / CBS 260.88 / M93) TaxID=1509407 RepID=A0A0L1JCM9_ASPN3|nr:uncharacterized protein ANOM_002281 [Aspergillus nomiae NRRL 13137]KNG89485.1 hypothetical protein ANOM_002281 [Aspergillus nomiae NRRL 13137]